MGSDLAISQEEDGEAWAVECVVRELFFLVVGFFLLAGKLV